jgi:hypothetical protein
MGPNLSHILDIIIIIIIIVMYLKNQSEQKNRGNLSFKQHLVPCIL